MIRFILITLLFIASCGYSLAQLDTLHWNKDRPLLWADFAGEPVSGIGVNGEILCMISANFEKPNAFKKTKFSVVAYLDRTNSWVDTSLKDKETMIYFQTMFNIYELQARRLRKDLAETKFGSNPTELFNQKYTKMMEGLSDELNKYRRETKMSLDQAKVLEWRNRINLELTNLTEFVH